MSVDSTTLFSLWIHKKDKGDDDDDDRASGVIIMPGLPEEAKA